MAAMAEFIACQGRFAERLNGRCAFLRLNPAQELLVCFKRISFQTSTTSINSALTITMGGKLLHTERVEVRVPQSEHGHDPATTVWVMVPAYGSRAERAIVVEYRLNPSHTNLTQVNFFAPVNDSRILLYECTFQNTGPKVLSCEVLPGEVSNSFLEVLIKNKAYMCALH
jgi:hypothetical protein